MLFVSFVYGTFGNFLHYEDRPVSFANHVCGNLDTGLD
jgi:hypothetical protein